MIQIPRNVDDGAADDTIVSEGRILARILRVTDEDHERLLIRYQILKHSTDPTMVGVTAVEKFPLTGAAAGKLPILLKRLGIVERGTPDDDAQYDEQELLGKEVIADVVHQQLDRKKGSGTYTVSQWPWGAYWAGDDPRGGDFAHAKTTLRQPAPATAFATTSTDDF